MNMAAMIDLKMPQICQGDALTCILGKDGIDEKFREFLKDECERD